MDDKKMFHSGITFEEFVNRDEDSYGEETLKIFNGLDFNYQLTERIKLIDKKINILICAEIWCPDCMINVPVIEKMRVINKNIELSIVTRDGNEDFLKKISKEEKIKIPTFVFFDEEFNILGKFIERPSIVRKAYNSGIQSTIIVTMRKYKRGGYTEETLKDILNTLSY